MSPLDAWSAPCDHDSGSFLAMLGPVVPAVPGRASGVVEVAVTCAGCQHIGQQLGAVPAPVFAGRPVGAG